MIMIFIGLKNMDGVDDLVKKTNLILGQHSKYASKNSDGYDGGYFIEKK